MQRQGVSSVPAAIKVFGAALILGLTGCASWKPVPYTPDATASTNPAEDFQRLVMTAKSYRPSRIDMHDSFATLVYGAIATGPSSAQMQTVTIPFKEIETITLLSSGGDFAVRASDSAGAPIYEYVAMSRNSAEEFINVLAALSAKKK